MLKPRRGSKGRRFTYEFEMVVKGLTLPDSIANKLQPSAKFFILWKVGQDEAAVTKATQIKNGCLQWNESMALTTVLIKTMYTDKLYPNLCRILLKQIKDTKESTVGAIKLDLSQYSQCDTPETLQLHFAKCNIDNVYLNCTLSAAEIESDQEPFAMDDTMSEAAMSVYSMSEMAFLPSHSEIPQMGSHPSLHSIHNIKGSSLPPHLPQQSIPPYISAPATSVPHSAHSAFSSNSPHNGVDYPYGMTPDNNSGGNSTVMHHDAYAYPNPNLTPNPTSEVYDRLAEMENRLRSSELENNRLRSELGASRRKVEWCEQQNRENTLEWERKNANLEKEIAQLRLKVVQTERQKEGFESELNHRKLTMAQLEEKLMRNSQKYGEIISTLHSSGDKLKRKVGELCSQNDDLEHTLIMVRNSWTQTGHVMENQVHVLKNRLQRVTKECEEYRSKYESMRPEYEMAEKLIEKLQRSKIALDHQMSNMELQNAAKVVEFTNTTTQLSASKSRIDRLKCLVFRLLRGFKNEKNEHICLIEGCCDDSQHQSLMRDHGIMDMFIHENFAVNHGIDTTQFIASHIADLDLSAVFDNDIEANLSAANNHTIDPRLSPHNALLPSHHHRSAEMVRARDSGEYLIEKNAAVPKLSNSDLNYSRGDEEMNGDGSTNGGRENNTQKSANDDDDVSELSGVTNNETTLYIE